MTTMKPGGFSRTGRPGTEILAKALVQSSVAMVLVSDPDLRLEFVSEGFRRFCGLSAQDLEGRQAEKFQLFKAPSIAELCLAARMSSRPLKIDAIMTDYAGRQVRVQLEISKIEHDGLRFLMIQAVTPGASLIEGPENKNGTEVESRPSRLPRSAGQNEAGRHLPQEVSFQKLSKNMHGVVYSALPDRSCSHFYISGRMEELTGYKAEQFMADSRLFSRIIHPEDRVYVTRRIESALKAKTHIDIEYRIISRGNQVKWIRDRATPHYVNGKVVRIDGFMEDITQRRKSEQDLKAASMLWQTTFNAMNEAVMILDKEQKILRCNRTMFDFLKLPAKKVLGKRCCQILHGTDQPIAGCPCRAAQIKGARASVELAINDRWYEVSVDPQRNDDGQVIGYVHLMSDITERRQAEAALKEAHQTFLTVLDSIDATIFVADMDTYEIIFMNQTMKEVFGGDKTGKTCWSAFRGRSEPCDNCRNLLDGHGQPVGLRVWEGENPVTHLWFINYERAIKWIDGRWVRIQVSVDITKVKNLEKERIRTEARLLQAQKMEAIGTLAGGIAHDFNNILSAILGYAELAMDDARNGRVAEGCISEIVRAGNRARDLVQQILTFSRQTEAKAKPIQVRPIIKEALKLLRATLPSTIEMHSAVKSDAIVVADPTQIHQVIMNLCTNAGHAMRNTGGLLAVTLDEEKLDRAFTDNFPTMSPGRFLRLTVADTGCGIDPALIDKIFDPYFTTKQKGEGTGMGLAVVQAVVQGCRGGVAVASTPGKGTVFKVYLPIVERRTKRRKVDEQPVVGGNEHILFVDDEPALVTMGKQMLERLGYKVTVANGSDQALRLFRENPLGFDLVISDMTMPHMTGDILASEMMAVRPDLPVIICTGYSDRINQEDALKAGVKALIYKPMTRKDLAATVRSVLELTKGQAKLNNA